MAKQVKKSQPSHDGKSENQTVKASNESHRADVDAGSGQGVENLDKVRDILFGTQIRDTERRFGRLEERLIKDTADLRDETRKRLESLEGFIKKEMSSMVDRLKAEQGQRGEAVKELATELKEQAKSFGQRSTELQEQLAEAQREIRQELLDQTKSLRDELAAAKADSAAELERATGELRTDKVDRASLADLFTQLAARLNETEG